MSGVRCRSTNGTPVGGTPPPARANGARANGARANGAPVPMEPVPMELAIPGGKRAGRAPVSPGFTSLLRVVLTHP